MAEKLCSPSLRNLSRICAGLGLPTRGKLVFSEIIYWPRLNHLFFLLVENSCFLFVLLIYLLYTFLTAMSRTFFLLLKISLILYFKQRKVIPLCSVAIPIELLLCLVLVYSPRAFTSLCKSALLAFTRVGTSMPNLFATKATNSVFLTTASPVLVTFG